MSSWHARTQVVLEAAMRVIPTCYFAEALKLSLAGTTSPQMWGHLAVVAGCIFVAFSAATWARRSEQSS